jgi:RNA polymerase subunit RPABC4/transcription elongation factor Spt4
MDALDRLYRRVVESLAHVPRQMEGVPVTIGELYQAVVPYRGVRADLGLTELAAYEHTLLRFLAGERGYVSIDAAGVQDELLRELRAPNPILGVYRDYAEVGVHVNPNIQVRADAPPPPPPPPPPPSGTPTPSGSSTAAGGWPDVVPTPRIVPAPPRREPPPPPPRPSCPGCRSTLPEGRDARFCPFCGKPLKPVPCAACGAAVEPEWSFCPDCGSPRPALGAAAPPPPPGPERRLREPPPR